MDSSLRVAHKKQKESKGDERLTLTKKGTKKGKEEP
jgi:hypothetical protein